MSIWNSLFILLLVVFFLLFRLLCLTICSLRCAGFMSWHFLYFVDFEIFWNFGFLFLIGNLYLPNLVREVLLSIPLFCACKSNLSFIETTYRSEISQAVYCISSRSFYLLVGIFFAFYPCYLMLINARSIEYKYGLIYLLIYMEHL